MDYSLEINLKDRSRYENIVRSIVEYGSSVKDAIFENLPNELITPYQRIREIYNQEIIRGKGKLDTNSVVQQYMNVPGAEELVRYLLLATVLLTGFKNLRNELIYRVMARNYDHIINLIKSPSYGIINNVSNVLLKGYVSEGIKGEDIGEVSNAIHSFTYGLRKLVNARKTTLLRWVSKFRDIENFERELVLFYPTRANERRRRAIKTFIRWVSHETNLPIALEIMRRGAYRRYAMAADIYSTMVTIRSGAFLTLRDDRIIKIINKIMINRETGTTVRIDEVKGLVRSIGRISNDPIIYERGAFKIGHDYCSKLKCNECPINRVCMKFTWVRIK
ncbi:MAG: hypothetical protein TU36_001475 [Vulcanisaeta sp. AZ3]|jgi:hypothetical protein|nr:MAG: hypothetical protein TU36_04350 [Vulcanisaeta sp. AZ3]